MSNKLVLFILLFFLSIEISNAQSINNLRKEIQGILADKSATVGIAIKGNLPQDTLSINGDRHLPMQSVFKYHLALAVLHQVDQGKLTLDDQVTIDKGIMDKYSHLWSPLRKKYPNGADIPLKEILQYTVSLSDNVGCDVLFELIGGTQVVASYLHDIGIKDISIVYTEILMQAKWKRQYKNWTTAKAANQLLELFYKNANNLLSEKSYNFLLQTLKDTKTGKKTIRGLLPQDATIAHKTGYSGINKKGLTGARNDIGIIFLPDGSHFYLSVFVSDSMEDKAATQRIIADIAKAAWDYFARKK